MPRLAAIAAVLAPLLAVACARHAGKTAGTLAELRVVRPDVQEASVGQGLDQAMQNYRRFLEETSETAMTPEAMRRLADLQIEKQFGLRADAPVAEAGLRESDREFEQRTTAESGILGAGDAGASPGSLWSVCRPLAFWPSQSFVQKCMRLLSKRRTM